MILIIAALAAAQISQGIYFLKRIKKLENIPAPKKEPVGVTPEGARSMFSIMYGNL